MTFLSKTFHKYVLASFWMMLDDALLNGISWNYEVIDLLLLDKITKLP